MLGTGHASLCHHCPLSAAPGGKSHLRKMRFKEFKYLAQDHTARKGWSEGLRPGSHNPTRPSSRLQGDGKCREQGAIWLQQPGGGGFCAFLGHISTRMLICESSDIENRSGGTEYLTETFEQKKKWGSLCGVQCQEQWFPSSEAS